MKHLSQQTESQLGYDSIRQLLQARAVTTQGKERCLALKPLPDPKALPKELTRVEECRDLLLFDDIYTLDFSGSVSQHLEWAAVPGNWLPVRDVFEIMRWLRMVRDLINYFQTRKLKCPALFELVEKVTWNKQLLQNMERIIDDRGNVKDNASPKLQELRREHKTAAAELRKTMQSILRNAIANGWSDSDELTMRNDRLVIPMKADFKGRIKGFVQDVSSSGQTIFLEPSSSLEANNRLRQLAIEEQNEIVRLLMAITAQIKEDLYALTNYAKLVKRLDFIRAKARLAVDLQAVKPIFEPEKETLMLVNGRHPLLLLKQGMGRENVVPLSMTLDPKNRIVLVSGPNAGGKSVTLKTVGLLQLMLQSGLLLPVDERSEFPWFKAIFVDIGDEQSIQSDLSTYTSHLKNMRTMLARLKPGMLFLMDEFGSGTDPRMGGAIAEAFLQRFLESGANGVVTTHYGNLKAFADRSEGILNAAMQFNPETLSPTFRIEVGIPGRSYAFEIARNVGVPEEVLTDARSRIEGDQLEAEDLLLKLEEQKATLDGVLDQNKKKNYELAALLKRNKELSEKLKADEQEILRAAHQKAQQLIDAANAKIEATIREIRESQADKERTKVIRRELAEMLPEMPAEEAKEAEEILAAEANDAEIDPELLHGEQIAVDDWVLLTESNSYGKVLEIQGKRAVVALGEMRVTIKLKNLVKMKAPGSSNRASRRGGDMVARKANISLEVSVKGLRVEAALPIVQRFIDEALLANLPEVRILHGKGTGALRAAIRECLAMIPEVKRFEDASLDSGGSGWTVCHLGH